VQAWGAARVEAACRGRTRGPARVWLKVGDDPDGRGPPGGEREERGVGLGRWARKGGAEQPAGLGHAEGKEGEGAGQAGLDRAVERKKKKRLLGRALREEAERGEKERVGRAKRERGGEKKNIQMHLNLNLKFKFKWKTNNRTMQCGMKCTRPIFSYISFCG
jgi:hypothetical protein